MDQFDKEFDQIVKKIEQPGEKAITQQIINFSNLIKQYAIEFLRVYEMNEKELQELADNLKKSENAIRGIQQGQTQTSYEYRRLTQNRHLMTKKDHRREMIQAGLLFQKRLNQLLDQKVELVYVYEDDQGNPVLYTIDERKLGAILTYQSDKGRKPVGRFYQTRTFQQALKTLTKYQIDQKFNLDYFNYVYKQVIWRFNYGKKRDINLIIWLNYHLNNFKAAKTKWLKASVDKAGDIKQAYASVLLDRNINSKKHFNSPKLDENVHYFMEQVAKVDSQSGLLKGDVTVGKIEYAIKGSSAQTLGISQIVDLARKITRQSVYSQQDLINQKQEFHEKAGTRNHIRPLANKQLTREFKKMAQSIKQKNKYNMDVLIEMTVNDNLFP